MKLSEALRYLARRHLGSREIKVIGWRDAQCEHWDRISARFNAFKHTPDWYSYADDNDHRAMILLFAACIAEDEGD